MLVKFCRLCCLSVIALASGCAMCSHCDDYTYPTEGGKWQRLDPIYGRVGSLFTPEVWTVADGYYDEEWSEAGEGVLPPTEATEPAEETTSPGDAAPAPPGSLDMPGPVPETSVLENHFNSTR